MKRNLTIAAALLAVLMTVPAAAQTKKETKQYNKAVAKNQLALYEKFLQQYPGSTYVQDVYERMDKINTSTLTEAQIGEALSGVPAAVSTATRLAGRDRIYVLAPDGRLLCVEPGDSARVVASERYTLDPSLSEVTPDTTMEVFRMGAHRYLFYKYKNSAPGSAEVEYVSNLLDLGTEELSSAMFRGRKIGGVVEGQSPESLSLGTGGSPEIAWLLSRFGEDPVLKQITKADAAADDAVLWWYRKNPSAADGKSHRIAFGILTPENSIIDAYQKARKERSGNWMAACFNHRGNTMVCAYNRSSGEYVLAWCEPINTRGRAGRDMQSVYFETGSNILDMMYYQGRRSFKQKLNLSSKTMTVSR